MWHFDFKDYKDAFEVFYRQHGKDESLCFVVSTHPLTSGYWIEIYDPLQDYELAHVYRTEKAVKALERRVARVIENTRPGMSPGLIL